ncbi:MAG TPA: FAD-dependent oxidoreductase [Bauldia sp.]|nr:FAD-dependent oxidoreductase [Bauldia sp.]
MRVLVCGGGVIGVAIAYYLSLRGAAPVVIEPAGIANAASGKSGGFLALDWCDGTRLSALARRSFALHAELADVVPGGGYRRLTTYGGFSGHGGRRDAGAWISDRIAIERKLGTPETTAQIDPAPFTTGLMRAAEDRGATMRRGAVTGILREGDRVTGVTVDGDPLMGEAVVIAMGPWSILAAAWLPLPPVYGLKGHSVVYDTGDAVPPVALFLEVDEAGGGAASPEVFPRPNGTTYVCAISSESPLPVDPAAVAPDPGAIDRLIAIAGNISPHFDRARVIASQACFRPVTADGLPLIGAVPGVAGAYVASGHSVWGMLNAPATGEAMAGLILDGDPGPVDLAPFDPGRLRRFDAARLRTG